MKRVLITGGAGFIGSNLCRKLLKEEDTYVICLDNFYTGKMKNIEELLSHPRFEFIEHDIIDAIDIKVDEIYNMACPASPPSYQKDAVYTTKTCILGVINMLELATKYNAKLMQFSTSEVYGNPLIHPQNENYRGNVNMIGIRACYDEGKRCAETLCFDYNRQYGTKVKVIRIFNTYGPRMDENDGRVISNFVNQALQGKDITIYGDGRQTRSFCYIDDLLEGIERMMNTANDFMGPINLGNPEEFTIEELVGIIKEEIKITSNIVYLELPSDDPIQRRPNINLAHRKLGGWTPKVSLREGLRKTIKYFSENNNVTYL